MRLLSQKGLPSHLRCLLNTHQIQDGGCDVSQTGIVLRFDKSTGSDDKGNTVGRVCSVWSTFLIIHLISIPVIGGNQEDIAMLLTSILDNSNCFVSGGTGNYSRLIVPCVANHVWI